jgi:hypothetical protein
MAEPALKLATDIVKRPAEKLTTSGALKVGANSAAKGALKVAPKALGVAGLMLNSAPSVAEPTPNLKEKIARIENLKNPSLAVPKTEAQKGFTKAEKSKRDAQKATWDEIKASQKATAPEVATPTDNVQFTDEDYIRMTGGRFVPEHYKQSVADANKNLDASTGLNVSKSAEDTKTEEKQKENEKQKKERVEKPVMSEEKNITPSGSSAEATEAQQRRLNYNNLYSYYKSGGFGDPSSGNAKRDFGFAILETIGGGLTNAGKGIKGQGADASKWENILKQGKSNQTEFEMLDKQLENNMSMQNYINKLRKDFEKWRIDNSISYGTDKEKMDALKAFTNASGGQLENDWKNILLRTGLNIGSTVGTAYLMNALK